MANQTLHLPICTSCKRPIMPNDKCVKFNCPNCGKSLIWRCQSCREFSRAYICKECNFTGP